MEKIKLLIERVKGAEDIPIPDYMTKGSSGMDLVACIDDVTEINPGEFRLIPTGIKIELPEGYEAQIRPRSGLALKHGVTILNSPGTIDSDYRGEIKVILINFGKSKFIIHRGDRIAQMVISRVWKADRIEVTVLNKTLRGDGGFGHTGINSLAKSKRREL